MAVALRSLPLSTSAAGVPVRGAATHRVLGRWLWPFLAAVKLCAGSGTFGRVTEQPVLSPDDKRADRTLGRVVVHRQVAVLDVAFQFAPVAGQVTDGLAQGILRRDLRLRFLYPVFQLSQQWQAALHAGNLTIFVVTVLQVALDAIELIDQVQCDVSASCFALGLYFRGLASGAGDS